MDRKTPPVARWGLEMERLKLERRLLVRLGRGFRQQPDCRSLHRLRPSARKRPLNLLPPVSPFTSTCTVVLPPFWTRFTKSLGSSPALKSRLIAHLKKHGIAFPERNRKGLYPLEEVE